MTLTRAAVDVGVDVARRVADPATLAAAVTSARRQTTLPVHLQWRDHTVAAGYAGTALLFAAADAAQPGEGWDRAGHRHLAAAVESGGPTDPSLYGGLAGIGFAAVRLAAGRERYGRLLAAVDGELLPLVTRAVRRLDQLDGCGVGVFDVISGLTGVGAYLLTRRHHRAADAALLSLLGALTRLLGDEGEPRRWHTPADLVGGPMSEHYPWGNHNCGLAHGLPGPLALLSIAFAQGARVDGMDTAIGTAARWLAAHRVEQPWGPGWPNAVSLPDPERSALAGPGVVRHLEPGRTPSVGPEQVGLPGVERSLPTGSGVVGPSVPERTASVVTAGVAGLPGVARWASAAPARAAWCYGTPGVARALWLAGTALGDDGHRELAVRAMLAVLARAPRLRGLTSPTFCHGTAGLLQITRRFANDTGLPEFAAGADGLADELLDVHEPASLLGYRSVEPGGVRVDAPGLLDGAPGVALTLLATSPADQGWDRLFLLA